MLDVESVVKTYETVRAVDGISFAARPGEIFGLIGPNGAGKSTIIRMIMNIIAPDSGRVLFDGKPMREGDKARIGYLPEERGLYKKGKVMETLLFIAALKGVPERDARKGAEAWLSRFDLLEWKDRKVEELSKGMAQKVQFVATVVHDPAVMLFDEPFSGLDPASQDILLAAMVELKESGKTVLFSTHIMDHAEKICDKLLLIDKGRAVVSGPVSEVKASYGRNSVQVEFDGDASFVRSLPYVTKITEYPRWMEVELDGDKSSTALFSALAGRLEVRRFEVLAPSLHKIFISLTGAAIEDTAKEGRNA